jgi:hypothetical protein
MLSLEPEIQRLRPLLGDGLTDALIARERREVFSVHPEVRIAGWGGAVLLATAAGIVLKDHLDRIGPVAIAVGIALAAAICYGWTWWHRDRAGVADDYVLLLGALLLSADVAFLETQFDLFGDAWPRHFLLMALLHGAAAYLYRSRMLLSLSIAALASWIGVEQSRLASGDMSAPELAARAFLCAALLLGWREIDGHVGSRLRANENEAGSDSERRKTTPFSGVFEHFAAHLALVGGLALVTSSDTRLLGLVATLAVASAAMVWGFRERRESFVLYAFLYAVIAVDIFLVTTLGARRETTALLVVSLSMIFAIVALIAIHSKFREQET